MLHLNKLLLLLLSILICISLSGKTYYVSPNGSDASGFGTINLPWFTLNKAWTVVAAGDIIYMRGGTYRLTSQQNLTGKDGTSGNLISIIAYPGEHPVFDFIASSGVFFGITMGDASFIQIKGLRVTGIPQDSQFRTASYGLFLKSNVTNCTFEQMETDHIGGWGICVWGDGNDNLLFLNCDSHHNYDPLGDLGYGGSDGFESASATSTNITLRGCRFWSNSDDGLDLRLADGVFTIENCWSFWNGYREDGTTSGGNGEGFKLGNSSVTARSDTRRTVKNCLAFENRTAGIESAPDNVGYVGVEIYNTTVYKNGEGMNFNYTGPSILRNNITYNNLGDDYRAGNACTHDHNNFDLPVTITDADFVSVSSVGMDGPRQSDGSLPVLDFLKLASGSKLIDAGVDFGIPFSGKSPDLGAFEIQIVITYQSPVFTSATIENAAPSLLEMTYDLTLNNLLVPANSSFNVQVNSVARTVNSVATIGSKVRLTLTSAIVFGDIVTVAYVKPSINPLQTASGGMAASISNQKVINNCLDPNKSNIPPVLVIKNEPTSYSGFIGQIDASGSYNVKNAILSYEWTVPNNVSISSNTASRIKFLSPVVNTSQTIEFQLKVTDGTTTVLKSIPITAVPYKPELDLARIISIEASNNKAPDFPNNISDGNLATKWSATGDNQWLLLKLAEPFKISHLEIAFLLGQKYSSYFDIYASKDKLIWEPILINTASCNFSGNIQVFDFPALKMNTGYSYIKFVGHGNSLNWVNNIAEFKIFGIRQQNPSTIDNDNRNIIIYPNPAADFFNISVEEPSLDPVILRLIDFSGRIVFEDKFGQGIKNIQIPSYIRSGIYIVELISKNLTLFSQKLVVKR